MFNYNSRAKLDQPTIKIISPEKLSKPVTIAFTPLSQQYRPPSHRNPLASRASKAYATLNSPPSSFYRQHQQQQQFSESTPDNNNEFGEIFKILGTLTESWLNYKVRDYRQSKMEGQALVRKLLMFSEVNKDILRKFDEKFFMDYLDREKLELLSTGVSEVDKQLSVQEFVLKAMRLIQHQWYQNLQLAIGLTNLYSKIRQSLPQTQPHKFRLPDLTSYICSKISSRNPDLVLPHYELPITSQKLEADISKIRDIDIDPPIVHNYQTFMPRFLSFQNLPIISRQCMKNRLDKKIDNQALYKLVYMPGMGKIVAMSRLAGCLNVYSLDLVLKARIRIKNSSIGRQIGGNTQISQLKDKRLQKKLGSSSKLSYKKLNSRQHMNAVKRQHVILSFAFSNHNDRIGAIIKDFGLVFWESSDNFKTEKIIRKQIGDKIFYLQLLKQWATADKNSIYFVDLESESISRTIKLERSIHINDLCEIPHLRSICVACILSGEKVPNANDSSIPTNISLNTETNNNSTIMKESQRNLQSNDKGGNGVLFCNEGVFLEKYLFIYQGHRVLAKLRLDVAGCHSLYYVKQNQALIPLGYKSNIDVYTFDQKTYDLSLRSTLLGHKAIVNCVSALDQRKQQTPSSGLLKPSPVARSSIRGQNSVPNFSSTSKGSIIITGDDSGVIRIWQLNYMRCLQVVKLANSIKCLQSISVLDRSFGESIYLIYGDIRINVLPMESSNNMVSSGALMGNSALGKNAISSLQEKNLRCPIDRPININSNQNIRKGSSFQECRSQVPLYGMDTFIYEQHLYIITTKDCRKISCKTGRVSEIYLLCAVGEEVKSACIVNNLQYFLVGTSKGNLQKFDFLGRLQWKFQAHEGQILQIYIQTMHQRVMIVTVGIDGCLKVWESIGIKMFVAEKQYETEKYKLSQDNFASTQFRKLSPAKSLLVLQPHNGSSSQYSQSLNQLKICFKTKIMVVISDERTLSVWDYQSLTVLQTISLSDLATCIELKEWQFFTFPKSEHESTKGTNNQFLNSTIILLGYADGKVEFYRWSMKSVSIEKLGQIKVQCVNTVVNKYHRAQENHCDSTHQSGLFFSQMTICSLSKPQTNPDVQSLQNKNFCENTIAKCMKKGVSFIENTITISDQNLNSNLNPNQNAYRRVDSQNYKEHCEQCLQIKKLNLSYSEQLQENLVHVVYGEGWIAQYKISHYLKRAFSREIQNGLKLASRHGIINVTPTAIPLGILNDIVSQSSNHNIGSGQNQYSVNLALVVPSNKNLNIYNRSVFKHGSTVSPQMVQQPQNYQWKKKQKLSYTQQVCSIENNYTQQRTSSKLNQNKLFPSLGRRQSILMTPPTTSISEEGENNLIWRKRIHKDQISCAKVREVVVIEGVAQKKVKFLHTLCVDGYYKRTLVEVGGWLQDGKLWDSNRNCHRIASPNNNNKPHLETVCSLNLKYPLPIKWSPIPKNKFAIVEDVKHVLKILSNITKSPEFKLSRQQFEKIDVSRFLKSLVKRDHTKKQQFKVEDFFHEEKVRKQRASQKTLQSLDLYQTDQVVYSIFPTQFKPLRQQVKNIKDGKDQQIAQKIKQHQAQQNIQLLKDSYLPVFRNSMLKSVTLKALQAQKRVRMIKQSRQDKNLFAYSKGSICRQSLDSQSKPHDQKRNLRKDYLQWLSPNYFPNLMSTNNLKQNHAYPISQKSKSLSSQSLQSVGGPNYNPKSSGKLLTYFKDKSLGKYLGSSMQRDQIVARSPARGTGDQDTTLNKFFRGRSLNKQSVSHSSSGKLGDLYLKKGGKKASILVKEIDQKLKEYRNCKPIYTSIKRF